MKWQGHFLRSRGAGWYALALLTLACVYVGTGRLGLSLGAANRFATLVWLPSGLAVTALFLWGIDLWPAITLGAFLVNVITGAPLLVAAGMSIGNTLEAVVCTVLLKRNGVRRALDSLHDVVVLVLLATPISALISATLGVGSLALGRVIVWSSVPMTWSTWWLGDMMSVLVLTPLLLTWSARPQATLSRERLLELSLISMSVLVVGLFVFVGLFHPTHWDYPVTHLVFPLLTWAALRFGPRGATAAIAAFASFAVVGTIQGVSPFSTHDLWLGLLVLQTFMGITAATTLVLAAIVAERYALEQRKDEFIGMASHELRTPLTSLLLSAEWLRTQLASSDHPRALHTVDIIETQAKTLSRLIADLLDLSKIQAGKLTFAEQAVDMDALVHEVVEQVQLTCARHQISIEGSATGTIVADPERLGQVLSNLLTNAVKYSPRANRVLVSLTSTAECLTISVQDFGLGIAAPEQAKIFERFYRISRKQERTTPGLGIGLFIARQIIEHYGGELWVDSVEGQGSIFSFSLPWRSPQTTKSFDGSAAQYGYSSQ